MKSKVVKIGNSQCVRIPKSVIEQCNIREEILIKVINKNLLIEPIRSVRKNWEKKFCDNNIKDKIMIDFGNDFDSKEWEW